MNATPLKTVIIVPTYNERGNIAALVDALQEQFLRLKHDMHILVVDDSSPDGTADVVRGLQASHPNLHLLNGQKQGLGVAYIRGMRHAMQERNRSLSGVLSPPAPTRNNPSHFHEGGVGSDQGDSDQQQVAAP